jgi:hypothetical protein
MHSFLIGHPTIPTPHTTPVIDLYGGRTACKGNLPQSQEPLQLGKRLGGQICEVVNLIWFVDIMKTEEIKKRRV